MHTQEPSTTEGGSCCENEYLWKVYPDCSWGFWGGAKVKVLQCFKGPKKIDIQEIKLDGEFGRNSFEISA